MMEIRRFFFNLVDSALRQCIKPEFYQIEKSWFCVHVPERIVGFHMTSLKFKIQNCRSYRDFYFHDILEQPKLNFHTCIFSLKKRSWFCDVLRLNSDKLWRDAAFIWQPREQSCRLKTLLSLQCLTLCRASSWSFLSALNSWTQNCRKSQIFKLLTVSILIKARVIMVIWWITFHAFYSCSTQYFCIPSTFESLRLSRQIYLYCKTIITRLLHTD